MNEEPQVRGCYNITFICTPTNQETVSVLEKTQAKYKQQQLSNNYSNHVVYPWVTIIHDKMINNQAHKL